MQCNSDVAPEGLTFHLFMDERNEVAPEMVSWHPSPPITASFVGSRVFNEGPRFVRAKFGITKNDSSSSFKLSNPVQTVEMVEI